MFDFGFKRSIAADAIPRQTTTLSVSWLNNQFKAVAVHRGRVEGTWERPGISDGPGNFGRRSGMGERLRPGGGYRNLRSFQVATIIYDATVSFCGRFLDKRSRTVDQMVQAARSGRQNIAEGSRASTISSSTELRLVNVARASLDELLLDYEDFLRQHRKQQWDKNDREARAVRSVGREHPSDHAGPIDATAYAAWLNHVDPAVVANAVTATNVPALFTRTSSRPCSRRT